ncbi:hypothetical protein GCM10007079_48810 [Nocardiopsis terrae]|nr:hypothetical protein GCM10007079_48810 [Nocardiopsis terrae]
MIRRTTRRGGYSGAGSAGPAGSRDACGGGGPGIRDGFRGLVLPRTDCSMRPPIPDARKPHGTHTGGKHPPQVYVNAVDLSNRYLYAPSGMRRVHRGANLET